MSIKETYEGMCIGGPRAGQMVANQSRTLMVVTRGAYAYTDALHGQPDEPPMQHTYRWQEHMGCGFWLAEGIGAEGLMRELLTHYRPTAFQSKGSRR